MDSALPRTAQAEKGPHPEPVFAKGLGDPMTVRSARYGLTTQLVHRIA
ncbi:hypothetical protein [Streptomyces sp. NPDC005486]